jgi:hypothetical protein
MDICHIQGSVTRPVTLSKMAESQLTAAAAAADGITP